MFRTYAIALNTFREAVRDRVLYGVLGFAVFVLLFALALAELSLGQEERVVADIGFASISLSSSSSRSSSVRRFSTKRSSERRST